MINNIRIIYFDLAITDLYHSHEYCLHVPHLPIMPKSHKRILRRIIRRFGIFPPRTYSNCISNDANVRITYEERSGRVLNLNRTCA